MEKDDEISAVEPEVGAATGQPRITFPSDVRTGPRQGREARPGRAASRSRSVHSRRRSTSRNSYSSFRSRHAASPYSELQIEYRTLSIQVSDANRASEERPDDVIASKKLDEDYFANLEYHKLQTDQVCQRLNVDPYQGLSSDAAKIRLDRDGPNTLPKPKTNYIRKILGYVFGGFCSILWVGAIIFFLCWQPLSNPPSTQNLALAVLILIVIFLQTGFSAFQDWSTARTMGSILDLLPSYCLLKRDGQLIKLRSNLLVAGDIVELKTGDKVPADTRIISHSGDIRFDRSVLTGESDEIEGAIDETDDNFLESRNIALMGTTVLNGTGVGVVILTGDRSVMGRIAKSTATVKESSTLIQREIWRFVRIIICMTVTLALLILIAWVAWLRTDHKGFLSVSAMLVNVMACVVAFIPEGMPVAVSLTLMMVARRMKAVNILPKSLSVVETLGCVDVICSDKTGTLTQGHMSVSSVCLLDRVFESPDDFHDVKSRGDMPAATSAMHAACMICNDANFDPNSIHLPIKDRTIQGSSTDSAVFRFAAAGPSGDKLKKKKPPLFTIPFNSKNKWMLTLLGRPEDNRAGNNLEKGMPYHAMIKGAPDVLMPACTAYWSATTDSVQPLSEESLRRLKGIQDSLSRKAERVLLVCEKTMVVGSTPKTNAFTDEVNSKAISDLTVIGILGIIDPPRPEIPATIASCRQAGTRFFMVTGDYALTAAAIAKDIGIITGERGPDTVEMLQSAEPGTNHTDNTKDKNVSAGFDNHPLHSLVLEGSQLRGLGEEDWDAICAYEEVVFARTTPEQKLRIVTELRARHHVVAVTGDGVNDAPALRAADVGVAVAGGSAVAIEAADLVLIEDFDSMVGAIRLGRLVFQNLQKVIAYLLPAGSWSEIWPVLLNVFFGTPLPLSAFLMIIICVFTDLFLSLSLIMEKEEFDLMATRPRNARKDHLVNLRLYLQAYIFTGTMETVAAHAMFFLYMWKDAKLPIKDLFFLYEKYTAGFHGYTEEELVHFNNTGQCVYFVTLVFLQWGNILAVRNRRLSILQADPITKRRRNLWIGLGMLISLVIAIFVTEVPGFHRLFDTASVPIEFWLIPIPLGLGILWADEIRKLIVRQFPKSFVAKLAW